MDHADRSTVQTQDGTDAPADGAHQDPQPQDTDGQSDDNGHAPRKTPPNSPDASREAPTTAGELIASVEGNDLGAFIGSDDPPVARYDVGLAQARADRALEIALDAERTAVASKSRRARARRYVEQLRDQVTASFQDDPPDSGSHASSAPPKDD